VCPDVLVGGITTDVDDETQYNEYLTWISEMNPERDWYPYRNSDHFQKTKPILKLLIISYVDWRAEVET
jgi:hypothetical protein